MALSGLDIYKLLPKTNCKDCGFATCLAFAMALAQKKVSLDKCPHVTAEAKAALEGASQPPIKLVTIGTGEHEIEMGNETVMYRHEQKFYHPAGIGFLIEDTMDEGEIDAALSKINELKFERVGQKISADLVCIKNSSKYKNKFANAVRKATVATDLAIALSSSDAGSMGEAVRICVERRPLVICEDPAQITAFAKIAKDNKLPLSIPCLDLDAAAQATELIKKEGVDEIVINLTAKSVAGRIQKSAFLRRAALKKNYRPLGYPILVFTEATDQAEELAEAVSYVSKYASLVIVKNYDREFVLPLLVARQDIYQDPQKPVQVEPGIYEIGKVTAESPVLITTNFSITYFTVLGEVEASRVPSYIIACDAEGMSVLTAWAAEKFTPETIFSIMKKLSLTDRVAHREITIPGYVAVLSGKLQEISGWKVNVGPREASGIPNYLRSLK